ncbi:MAG: hypothetical protein RLO04_04750 [Limnobacter sp.]|jgi:hypothetical protein|uniref:hypothetical protein n=1 Tax=Limnobacter sp. TaxID=2003368 RepID=UPI0032EE4F6D
MSDQIELNEVIKDYFAKYPPILKIEQVSEILHENSQTTRDRIRRGTFPIKVIKEPGSRFQVMLIDLVAFLTTGKRQVPLPRELREKAPGKKRGRPTKAEQIAKARVAK